MVDPAARRSRRPVPRAGTVLVAILAVAAIAVGLGSCSGDDSASGSPEGECPVAPVSVVATIGPWGSIAEELAGDCAHVTTIVDGSRGDPHDVEPTPADRAAIEDADVVITNGLGYDAWADDALAAASSKPAVVVAGEVTGQETGANPHAWYDPTIVREAAVAITQALQEASPTEASTVAPDPASLAPMTPRSTGSGRAPPAAGTLPPSRCSTRWAGRRLSTSPVGLLAVGVQRASCLPATSPFRRRASGGKAALIDNARPTRRWLDS